MPKAILVTKQNIDFIMAYADNLGFNLDYLPDNVEYNAEEFGWTTYLITDGTPEKNNVTFTAMADADFNYNWKFADTSCEDQFVEIERV